MNFKSVNCYALFLLLANIFSFAVNKDDYDKCIRDVMGAPRAIPGEYCHAMHGHGLKVRPPNQKNIIILEGEPGCGKTTLAKKFAEETNSFCIVVNCGGMLQSGVMGSGSKVVIDAFETAISYIESSGQSAVLIFEEIDAFTRHVKNSSTNEESNAYKEFNVRSELHKKNGKLTIIGTTNHYDELPEAVKSRCTCIKIDPPTKEEYKLILKHMLIGQTIQHVGAVVKDLSNAYKSPQKKIDDYLTQIMKLMQRPHAHNTEHGTDKIDKRSIIYNDIDEAALKFVIKKFKDFIDGLPIAVKVKNCKFVQVASAYLDEWEKNPKLIDQKKVSELDNEAKQFKFDETAYVEKVQKAADALMLTVNPLQDNEFDNERLTKSIQQFTEFKALIPHIVDEELKLEWETCFIDELEIFFEFYKLAHDETKMAILLEFECKSIRILENVVAKVKGDIRDRHELATGRLKTIKTNVLKLYQNKTIPDWLRKVLDPVNEFAKEYEPALRTTAIVTSLAGGGIALGVKGYRYLQQSSTQTEPSTPGPVTQVQESKPSSASAAPPMLPPSPVSISFAHDPALAQLFPGTSEEALGSAINECAQNYHNKLSGSEVASSGASFLNAAASSLFLISSANSLYGSVRDFCDTVKGTKDHLSPLDRYLYNLYKDNERFNDYMEELVKESGRDRLLALEEKKLKADVQRAELAKKEAQRTEQENKGKSKKLEARKKALDEELHRLRSKITQKAEQQNAEPEEAE